MIWADGQLTVYIITHDTRLIGLHVHAALKSYFNRIFVKGEGKLVINFCPFWEFYVMLSTTYLVLYSLKFQRCDLFSEVIHFSYHTYIFEADSELWQWCYGNSSKLFKFRLPSRLLVINSSINDLINRSSH